VAVITRLFLVVAERFRTTAPASTLSLSAIGMGAFFGMVYWVDVEKVVKR
jgi:hypothetical protein